MQTIDPIVITGAKFTVEPRAQTAPLYNRVVIANHSQYLLTVRTGLRTAYIQQFTVDVVEYDPSDPKVFFQPSLIEALISGVVSHCTVVFFEPGEELPNSVYPASLPVYTSAATFIPGTVYLDEAHTMSLGSTTIENGVLQVQPPVPYANVVEIVSYNTTPQEIDVSAWFDEVLTGSAVDQRLARMTVPPGGTNTMKVIGLLAHASGFRIKYRCRVALVGGNNQDIGAKIIGLTL